MFGQEALFLVSIEWMEILSPNAARSFSRLESSGFPFPESTGRY